MCDVSAAGTTNQLKWKRKILTWVPYIAFLWSRPLREVGELLKATDTDGFYNPFSTHIPAIMWTLLFPRQTVIAGALNSRVGGTMGNRCHWLISSSLRPGLGRNNPRDSQIYIRALHSYWKLFAFSSWLRREASLYHRLVVLSVLHIFFNELVLSVQLLTLLCYQNMRVLRSLRGSLPSLTVTLMLLGFLLNVCKSNLLLRY